MREIVQADGDSFFKLIFYFIAFVLWIVVQAVAAKKKKARQQEMERNLSREPAAAPQEREVPPLDNDLKDLLEQLTGQSLPTPPPPKPVPPPVSTRVAVPQQQRPSDLVRRQIQVTRRPVTTRSIPPPVPNSKYETWNSPVSEPATAMATPVSVHARELSVNLPKTRLPSIRLPSINLQRPTANAGRVAWIKSPQSLRQSMIARMVLDPPKAVDFSLR